MSAYLVRLLFVLNDRGPRRTSLESICRFAPITLVMELGNLKSKSVRGLRAVSFAVSHGRMLFNINNFVVLEVVKQVVFLIYVCYCRFELSGQLCA